MSPKARLLAVGLGLAGLAGAAVATLGLGGTGAAEEPRPTRAGSTVAITRETLVETVLVQGELGYGAAAPVELKGTGTVTWLPAVGTTVGRGKPVARVDEIPVPLLFGSLPMYRPLSAPMEGPDVRQFEQNLKALGYSGFTVDDRYTESTATIVKLWQKSLGRPETGAVQPGDVVVSLGPVRVNGITTRIGAAAPVAAWNGTSTTRLVTAELDAGSAAWAVPGTAVTIALPDGATAAASVSTVADVAEATTEGGEASAQSTVEVVITVKDQKVLGKLERAPVTVRYVAKERADVLTVPVSALVALAEGGYGLELADGGYVGVTTGMFANGKVEVSGSDLAAGKLVRVPE